MTGEATQVLPLSVGLRELLSRSPLLLFLDVDGTLAPIAPRPEEAAVPERTRKLVARLAALDGVEVSLVSGRAARDARRMVGVTQVWAVGNHGFESIGPDGEELVDPSVAPFEQQLVRVAGELRSMFQGITGVLVEDKRWTLSVHYRLADPSVVPRVRSAVLRMAAEVGLLVHEGKMVLEVRPPVDVNKGTAVLALAERLGGSDGAVVFIGDDRTDEDAFRAIRRRWHRSLTVRVVAGDPVPSEAEFRVEGTEGARDLLEQILHLRTR